MTDAVWILVLVLLTVAALVVLRRRTPVLFWWLVGYPVIALRVLTTYRATMDACGLTVPASAVRRATARMIGREAAPVPPWWSLPRPTGSGLVMRLRMAAGQAPEDFTASAGRLRHAWGAHAVHIRPTKPGRLELRLIGWDVLSDVRPARRRRGSGPLTLPMALREDGHWHVRDFRTVPHELILGATQSGKSVYLRNLVCGLAHEGDPLMFQPKIPTMPQPTGLVSPPAVIEPTAVTPAVPTPQPAPPPPRRPVRPSSSPPAPRSRS